MNAANSNSDDHSFDYRVRERGKKAETPSHTRRSRHSARRRTKSPAQFNGIHRRRSRKLNW